MKTLICSLSLSLAVALASCSDDITSGTHATALTEVSVDIAMPPLPEGAEVVDQTLSFRNVATGRTTEFTLNQPAAVLPGLYDISYSARVFTPGAAETRLSATCQSVTVSGAQCRVGLEAFNNIESDDLVIAEIFFTGTLQPSGNTYNGDDYIKLYNNTDHVVYADGLTIFESKFSSTQKFDYTPSVMSEDVTVDALYTIPGGGTDVAVAPGEYLLICDTGIDHRVTNPNSFDLSHADFEWYDESSTPSVLDIDGPVPNLDKWYCYTQSFWILHNRGFKAYGIARIPDDRDSYLADYRYTYEYIQETIAGSFPMTQSAYRLPNRWVADMVVCSVPSLYAWQVCSPALDAGWTACGEIDGDKNRFFKSVRRKLLYVTADGRAVLQDTNNSTSDFNRDCVPSEIELQHSATDVNGTPAATITFDGITPK